MKRHKPKALHRPPYTHFLTDQYEVLMLAITHTLILGFIFLEWSILNSDLSLNADHHLLQHICGIKNNFNYPNEER